MEGTLGISLPGEEDVPQDPQEARTGAQSGPHQNGAQTGQETLHATSAGTGGLISPSPPPSTTLRVGEMKGGTQTRCIVMQHVHSVLILRPREVTRRDMVIRVEHPGQEKRWRTVRPSAWSTLLMWHIAVSFTEADPITPSAYHVWPGETTRKRTPATSSSRRDFFESIRSGP